MSCKKTVRSRRIQIYAQFPFGRNIFNFALRTTQRSSEVMPTCAFILECWLHQFQGLTDEAQDLIMSTIFAKMIYSCKSCINSKTNKISQKKFTNVSNIMNSKKTHEITDITDIAELIGDAICRNMVGCPRCT